MKRTGITLIFDEDTGEGSIKLQPVFTNNNVLLQIDCLQDWIGELTTIYNKGLKEFSKNGSYSRELFLEDDETDTRFQQLWNYTTANRQNIFDLQNEVKALHIKIGEQNTQIQINQRDIDLNEEGEHEKMV